MIRRSNNVCSIFSTSMSHLLEQSLDHRGRRTTLTPPEQHVEDTHASSRRVRHCRPCLHPVLAGRLSSSQGTFIASPRSGPDMSRRFQNKGAYAGSSYYDIIQQHVEPFLVTLTFHGTAHHRICPCDDILAFRICLETRLLPISE